MAGSTPGLEGFTPDLEGFSGVLSMQGELAERHALAERMW